MCTGSLLAGPGRPCGESTGRAYHTLRMCSQPLIPDILCDLSKDQACFATLRPRETRYTRVNFNVSTSGHSWLLCAGELLAIKAVSLMDDSGTAQRREAVEQLEHEVRPFASVHGGLCTVPCARAAALVLFTPHNIILCLYTLQQLLRGCEVHTYHAALAC